MTCGRMGHKRISKNLFCGNYNGLFFKLCYPTMNAAAEKRKKIIFEGYNFNSVQGLGKKLLIILPESKK